MTPAEGASASRRQGIRDCVRLRSPPCSQPRHGRQGSSPRCAKLTKLAREQLAATPALHGFRAFYYLIDRDNGKAPVLSFWETEEDLLLPEANNASVREHIKAEARLDSPPAEIFEVAFQAS
ncbi:MAG TPA: hypothetical protein VHX59_04130 [Mycobacteriales bacterium]|nr:hypothetical protein [Mycobacteriales bacterium]